METTEPQITPIIITIIDGEDKDCFMIQSDTPIVVKIKSKCFFEASVNVVIAEQ